MTGEFSGVHAEVTRGKSLFLVLGLRFARTPTRPLWGGSLGSLCQGSNQILEGQVSRLFDWLATAAICLGFLIETFGPKQLKYSQIILEY